MSEVVAYSNTGKTSFCRIRLDSGEQVFISIGSGSVRISKMLLGVIPIERLWESGDGSLIRRTFVPDSSAWPHPLDAIRDALLPCRSVTEVVTRLNRTVA